MVPVYCITLDKAGVRAKRTVDEFQRYGTTPTLFLGADARKFGFLTSIKLKDHDGKPYYISPSVIGCTVSHWMLWNHLITAGVPEAMIVEDDVKLCVDFDRHFKESFEQLPATWEFCFVGYCCSEGRLALPVTERIWDVRWPLCTHAYLVKPSALEKMMGPMAELRTPTDIALYENVFEKGIVKPYTMRPNLALQYETVFPP